MKQKLLTLMTLLLCAVSGAWAGEVTYTYFKVANSVLYGASAKSTSSPAVEGFVLDQIVFESTTSTALSAGSGQLKILKNKSQGLTISAHGKTITKIEMSAWKNDPSKIMVGDETLACTEGKVTWTGSATSVTFYNNEGSDRQFGTLTVTYDGDFLDGISSTTLSSLARSGYSENSIYSVNYTTTPVAYGLALNTINANSSMKLTNETGKLTLKSIKPIASVTITWDNATDVTVGGVAITKDAENKTNTWTAANSTTTEVAFVNASTSGNHTPSSIAVTFATTDPTISVTPATASAFNYVVGNGPSAAQTFTASLSNQTSDDITVSLNAGSDYYEISDDNSTFGTSNLTIGSGDAVYVRLKAGLALNASYAGTLRFANDGADNVDIALSGSVTNQTYTVTYDLNGASGDAPTQVPQEDGAVFALAAAPTRDCYTFDGWLCDIDGVTYAAGDDYTMTAAPTTFTAQWTANYASGNYNFMSGETIGTSPSKTITKSDVVYDAFQIDNLFFSSMKIGYDDGGTSATGDGDNFNGWKIKTKDGTIKFVVENDQIVIIGIGSIGSGGAAKIDYTNLSGVSTSTALTAATNNKFMVKGGTIVTITHNGTDGKTVTLKRIEIYDSEEIAIELPCEGGLGTFYHGSKDLDFSSCSAKAYVVTDISASSVTLKEVTLVPVGEGVVVKGTSKGETVKALTTAMTSDEVTAFYALDSKLYAGSVSVTSDGQYYALSKTDGKFHPLKKGVTIPAGKAYLKGSDIPAGANFLSLDFGEGSEATGIEMVESKKMVNNNVFYNLAGQQVAQPTKGLYIVNGKKVIIK